MNRNAKRDLAAVVLLVLIIGLVIAITWASRVANDTTPYTDLIEASEDLQLYMDRYYTLTPVELVAAEG